jgi:multiple sugar transport system permease protein
MQSVAEAEGRAAVESRSASLKSSFKSFAEKYFLGLASWPALVIMLAVTAVPFILTIGLSVTNYDLIKPDWKFTWWENFDRLIHDPQIPQIIFNTAYLVVGTTVLDTVLGLMLAVLMDSKFRGFGLLRSFFMLPIMTAPIVVALTWRAMFNNDAGWINYILGLLHLPQPVWLGDPHLAMPAVLISDMWTGIPFQAILLLAGLIAVPNELREAAAADGAGRLRIFWHITLPSIRPVLFIAVVLRFIESFRKFEGIQILTTGGPGIASTPLNLQIYNTGLFYDQVGYAASMGVILVVMIGGSVGLLYLIARRWG